MNIQPDSSSSSELQQRINKILDVELQKNEKSDALRLLLSVIDLTTLEGSDTDERIQNLCFKAKNFHTDENGIPNVAAVCVYPTFVKLAKNELRNSGVAVASVAGAFPSGQSPISVKLAEINFAVDQGADEIDMVISRGLFLAGRHDEVFNEIVAIRKATRGIHLKVILETGELITPGNIRLASEMAIQAGADFIKTSTGKIAPAATEEAVLVMIDVIKEYHNLTGKMIGLKPAGGISEPVQALRYFQLMQHELGAEWLNKNYFRLGASRLADKIVKQLLGEIA
jgi:deoxyribose-phosphate aldolase